jgi:hypothetical protein
MKNPGEDVTPATAVERNIEQIWHEERQTYSRKIVNGKV